MLVPVVADEISDVLRLVADPMRLRILVLLSQEQLCTCHLQAELGAKQTLVSHHLRALRDAGLVETEPCGRFTYYRIVPGALREAADTLSGLASAADAPKRPC